MKYYFVLALFVIILFLTGCDLTTNSLINTGNSNVLTYVYITEYGSTYHTHDCILIKGSKRIIIKRTEAIEKGYSECLHCFY